MVKKAEQMKMAITKETLPMPKNPKQHIASGFNLRGQSPGKTEKEIQQFDSFTSYYTKMAEIDETIGPALEFLAHNVVGKIGDFKHENPDITAFIKTCQEKMRGTMKQSLQEMVVYSTRAGFCVSEFTLNDLDGKWYLSSLVPLDPDTCTFKMKLMDDNAVGVSTIKQQINGKTHLIPREKCVLLRHGVSSSPYGKSRLRRSYKWWDFKNKLLVFWAISMEKYGMPTVLARSDENGDELEAQLPNLHSRGWIIIGKDDELEFLERAGINSTDFAESIAYANKMIYRTFFLPALLESGESGGSYSLGQVHYGMFDMVCSVLAEQLAEELREQLWKPLIIWNFGEQADYGEQSLKDSRTPEERKIIAEIFMSAVDMGVLNPAQGDLPWMRQQLSFPDVPEGADAGWQPEFLVNDRKRRTATKPDEE